MKEMTAKKLENSNLIGNHEVILACYLMTSACSGKEVMEGKIPRSGIF